MKILQNLQNVLQKRKRNIYQNHQLKLLEDARLLRESMREAGYQIDSSTILNEAREERLDNLTRAS